jgi:hypothetical protein
MRTFPTVPDTWAAVDWAKPSEQMQINKAATVTSREYRDRFCLVLQCGRKAASAALSGF